MMFPSTINVNRTAQDNDVLSSTRFVTSSEEEGAQEMSYT